MTTLKTTNVNKVFIVKVATTSNINLTSISDKLIYEFTNIGGPIIIDGENINEGERILFLNQTNQSENLIFKVNSITISGLDFIYQIEVPRDVFFILKMDIVYVLSGTINSESSFLFNTDDEPYTLGVSNIEYLVFSGSASGTVTGIPPSTINAIARWNDTLATEIKNSGVILDNSNNLTGITDIDLSGNISFVSGVNSLSLNPISISGTNTLSLPDITDTLITLTSTDTLTNKTITDSSNIVEANQLRTTGSPVIISSAPPPTAGQVLRATSATSANWQSLGGAGNTITYQLLNTEARATRPIYQTIAYFPWLNSRYSGYSNGTIIYRVIIGNRNLDIRLRDTTNGVTLGSATNLASAFTSFAVSNPGSDALLELQIRKSGGGGNNPQIFGALLEFDA